MQGLPNEQLIERALALVVQSQVAPGETAHRAQTTLHTWQDQSPEHGAAVREAQRRWSVLGDMAPDLRAHFDETAAVSPKGGQRRRLLLSVAGTVGLGALLGRGAWWYWQQPLFTASYATHTSQMRTVRLADGQDGVGHSQLELAPRTALNVALYRQRRIVTMTQGEVRFDVLPDAQRPFEVLTRAARIQVVGTVFTVRDRGGPVTVGVAQGQVRVRVLSHAADAADARAPDQESAVIDLRPGQAIDVRDGQAEPVRRADPADMAAWREGWLVFDNSLLADALTTINAYRAKPIQTDDPRVGALRLTGRFRANDSAGLVAALPTILPLHALTRPDGSVQLRLR